jgi:predicted kinase
MPKIVKARPSRGAGFRPRGRYGLHMTRLILINGAPGSGKSTIAQALAQDDRMALAMDVDAIKHSLGRWDADPTASGLHARRLSLALASEQLHARFDVVLGQYLARTQFMEDLERLAAQHGARFYEFVLDLDAAPLADRLAKRASSPNRLEHTVNNRLVGPEDASALVATLQSLRHTRPGARWVDARASLSSTLGILLLNSTHPRTDIAAMRDRMADDRFSPEPESSVR